MKKLVRTIALITVISLGSVCFCQEAETTKEKVKIKEKAKEKVKVKTEELEVALQDLERQKEELERNEEELQRQLMELDRQVIETAPTPGTVPMPSQTRASGIFLSKGRGGPSADISVVITSEDEKPESISQLTEDMGIMARILDKQVLEIPVPKRRTAGFGDVSLYPYTGASQQNQTKGIYISDFGALFLMDVDFPLKAEPKAEEKEEEKTEASDIWEQTKDELTGRIQRFGPVAPEIKRDEKRVAFDADKVKELKEKIIKSLKYASNIRGLESGDDIIVCVKSTSGQGRGRIREIKIYGSQIGAQTSGGGAFGGVGYGGAFAEEEGNLITGMTIIVDKDDVDEFAEGDMDYDEFCEEVEIIEY